MNILLFLETLSFLKPTQLIHHLTRRFRPPQLKSCRTPMPPQPTKIVSPIGKYEILADSTFTFLNITSQFRNWNMEEHGPLWTYNLNYMDWLEQKNITTEECLSWIDKFISDLSGNKVGLDAYPTALRIINWAKFFSKHPKCLDQNRANSMYAQTLLLEQKLEYHLLGNHLLEDAYALFIASLFFRDKQLYKKATRLLTDQLQEQILPDGSHYEQSPMYHCIMLDRLLDCINFADSYRLQEEQEPYTVMLREKAALMLGHLQNIIYKDNSIPLLNDSAYRIAPTPTELFRYAQLLNISWDNVPLKECGYRKMANDRMEIVADIGNIAASYQPGHSHADTFNYELRVDGEPVIVDTGISTYNKNERRQYERSTAAHNTVQTDGKNSSNVWGGFRMGRRAKVNVIKDDDDNIVARHRGFGNHTIHERHFICKENSFLIEDYILGKETNSVSYLHISPGLRAEIVSEKDGMIRIGRLTLKIEHSHKIEILKDYASTEYNQLRPIDVLALHFTNRLRYCFST